MKIVKTKVEVEGVWQEEYAAVEEEKTEAWDTKAKLRIVGKATPRVDGINRVSGSAKYTHDIQLPGMLYAKFLRCPHPHARIVRIETSKADALPGVRAVLTYRNTPQIQWRGGRTFIFDQTLRYHGDEVAAVAADEEDIAEDALELIEVEYEPLPAVLDPFEGMKPDAPQLWPEGNLEDGHPSVYTRGDVEKGFSQADAVVEGRYTTPVALHNSLETHGAVANWEGDQLTVWESTQHIFGVRGGVSRALGIPVEKVRVIKEYMGGGFGSKNGAGKHTIVAALFARMTGRPVRMVLDRHEENLVTGNRHATSQDVKIGAKRDGTLTAIYHKSVSPVGPWGWGSGVTGPSQTLYKCENVRTEDYAVYTNTAWNAAFRAPGYVEGTFALESAVDDLAAKLGIDPLEFRLRNYVDSDQANALPYTSKGLRDAYTRGAEKFGWNGRRKSKSGTKYVGFGMASQLWWGGGGPPGYATIKINPNATATVITGTQDIGTGTKTALAQVAAEELGLPIEAVTVFLGDTHVGLYSPLSAGSRTLATIGPPVRSAARDARSQLIDIASQILELPKNNLRLVDGAFYQGESKEPVATLKDVLQKLGDFMIIGRGSREPNPEGYIIQTFGAQFAEVEVDVETGEVTVKRIVAAHESGRVINPLLMESQIQGGVIQGLGFALTERNVLNAETGLVLTTNLEDYKIPTVLDVPEIQAVLVDQPDPICNNLGAKGIGEPPIIPTAAAIANAVCDAIGVRVRDLPITRDRVLAALATRKEVVTVA